MLFITSYDFMHCDTVVLMFSYTEIYWQAWYAPPFRDA